MSQFISSSSGWGRRSAAVLATASLVVAGLGFTATPANAHPTGDRAVTAGADWLTGQLTNGIVVGQYEDKGKTVKFDDQGLSADFAFALKAVGGRDATVTRIADAVATDVAKWYDSFGTIYTGSAAKAMALVQVAGRDATNFGGKNLQAVVEDRVATSAPIVGRVQNTGESDWQTSLPTDSLNVISQSWASRALTTAGSAKASDVTGFLLTQQCTEGFFRATLTVDKTSAAQGCSTGAADSAPSVDTTALTVINLLDTPGVSVEAKAAAAKGAAWLKSQQAADGSFSAGATEGVNANSTGLAGWALTKAGETAAATKAAGWLRGVQIADLAPCTTTLAADNGGLAYKPSTLAAARTAGKITPAQRDQFRRATAQALPALASLPASSAPLAISAPATAVEGRAVTVTVAGLGAGEAGCVTFGTVAKSVTGTGGDVTVAFTLPVGVMAHTFKLTTLVGSTTTTTTATANVTPEVGKLKARKVVTAKKNKFKLKVTCNDTEACAGKIVVRTTHKVRVGNDKRARKPLMAKKKAYSVAPGKTTTVKLKLTKQGRKVLAKRSVKVKAVQSAPRADKAVTKFRLRAK